MSKPAVRAAPIEPASQSNAGAALAVGFATAAAMWAAGYLFHLPGVGAPSVLVFFALIAILLAGGALASVYASLRTAALAGLAAGAINLLVLMSAVRSGSGDLASTTWIWLPASIFLSVLCSSLGAAIARGVSAGTRPAPHWPTIFALVTTAATCVLISVGGTVTGYEAGLAVPDWPNSYGYNMFLYPLSKMTGGIYYEHAHRLFGSLVGLTTLTLTIYVCITDRRTWVRALAVTATILVIGQGVLGGLRVTGRFTLSTDARELSPSLVLAVVHGVLAQIFLAVLACLAVAVSRTWRGLAAAQPDPASRSSDAVLSIVCVLLLLAQLIVGAFLRHMSSALAAHIGLALVVFILVGHVSLRAWAVEGRVAIVSKLGAILLALLMTQVILGMLALAMVWGEKPGLPSTAQVLATTAHQTNGAILLAMMSALSLWLCRLSVPAASREPRGVPARAGG